MFLTFAIISSCFNIMPKLLIMSLLNLGSLIIGLTVQTRGALILDAHPFNFTICLTGTAVGNNQLNSGKGSWGRNFISEILCKKLTSSCHFCSSIEHNKIDERSSALTSLLVAISLQSIIISS